MHETRYTEPPQSGGQGLLNLGRLLGFLWDYRGRALVALLALVLSKLANVGVPIVLKELVDALDVSGRELLALPVFLLSAYGLLRLAASLFNELRDAIFARVRYHAMGRLSSQVLAHLHSLSLRYHLERKTGAVTRDLERGARSVSSILNYLVFNIIPTFVEFALVAFVLLSGYEPVFALVSFGTVVVYVVFTFTVTNWRMHYRHQMNRLESSANNQAVDSLVNFETVKYFGNEVQEVRRYTDTLVGWEDAAVKSYTSMSALNFGQGAIIAIGVTLIMFLAADGVVQGKLSIGDLVLVNAFLLQLFIPLNFLGIVYRQLRYSMADMQQVFELLDLEPEIRDREGAHDLVDGEASLEFDDVSFAYQPDRPILRHVSLRVDPGRKVAVVGPSGAGKSTLARLLFRFFDVTDGAIRVNGQDVRDLTQQSLRAAIGVVPQDTVLFNDTIRYNLAYANPDADMAQIEAAARVANIHDFVASLPGGYNTVVGERGLKLSGGEKQRVAIARVILKNPRILVLDEATSSLDSRSEKTIQAALARLTANHTTLVIAHRLSTIVDADEILVMEAGHIVERGTHRALLAQQGAYAQLWKLQQAERHELQDT